MKYCLNYTKESQYVNIVDEIVINYVPNETSFLDFLKEHSTQKVHMKVWQNQMESFKRDEIKVLAAIRQQYHDLDFEVKLASEDKEAAAALKENNIPFWFSPYVVDWDQFHYYLSLGVCEVIVAEALGFELDKLSKIAHDAHVRVRAVANIAQTRAREYTPAIKKFFIRPEDIIFYEPYIDVCEFYYQSANQGDVFYKVYAKDKEWYGNLRELILDLGEDIDNRGILPTFASRRISCGKKCLKGAQCNICSRYQSLSKTLLDNNIIVKKTKED